MSNIKSVVIHGKKILENSSTVSTICMEMRVAEKTILPIHVRRLRKGRPVLMKSLRVLLLMQTLKI